MFNDNIPKDKILQLAIQFPEEVESRLSWLDEWHCVPKEEAILPQAMLYTQLIALCSLPSSKQTHFAGFMMGSVDFHGISGFSNTAREMCFGSWDLNRSDRSRSFNCAHKVVLLCSSDLPLEEHAWSNHYHFSMDHRINTCGTDNSNLQPTTEPV